MSIVSLPSPIHRELELGQTVVLIGGSAGVALETPRRAREEGAVDALSTAAFDVADPVINQVRSKSPQYAKPGAEPCFP